MSSSWLPNLKSTPTFLKASFSWNVSLIWTYVRNTMQVGNAVTDNYYDSLGTVAYWWSHSMISDATYKSILNSCNFTSDDSSKQCDDAVNYARNHELGNIDQYSIYTPSCLSLPNSTIRVKNTLLRRRISGYDPCTENYAEKYYNRPDVQKALHANITGIPYKWTACRLFIQSALVILALFPFSFKYWSLYVACIACWAVMFWSRIGRILKIQCYQHTRS